jgi:ribosomal protein S18 acetylase RimI-like enzyme
MDPRTAHEEARSVGKGDTARIEGMAHALAGAFHDDPVFSWVLRHDPQRLEILRRGFAMFLRRIWLAHEHTYTTAGSAGVAAWEPPGTWKLGVGEQLRLLPAMLAIFRRHSPRVLRSLTVLEGGHPAEPEHPPHYYLAFLGVSPPWQGRGLGSALLEPVLAQCDAERVPAYLEASTARNRALYERHGFDVLEEFTLGRGAPPQWRMWRAPHDRATGPRPGEG